MLKGVKGVEVRGSKEIEITGITTDSRRVGPGFLFIAKKGNQFDGHAYIPQAIEAGARAVVTDLYDPFILATQIITSDPNRLEALLASQYYRFPSKELFVVGVTGTKGKTTTTYLVRHLLATRGEKAGLIGTIETWIGEERFPSEYTTAGAAFNQKLLREMVNQGVKSAVLEVSSHGLHQGRVDQIDFDVGVFTNLSPDHLDYHKTIEAYAEAKRSLFEKVSGVAVLNGDDPWSSFMRGNQEVLLVGIENACHLRAENVILSPNGLSFTVEGIPFTSCLMGQFNVYNLLSAIGVGKVKGLSIQEMSDLLIDFPGVPGRLERVPNQKGVHVFVDYAHTGESLGFALATLRRQTKGRLLVVFGCGGDRDPRRRSGMAEAAERYADLSIITTDNPRSEDPEKIAREIFERFVSKKNVLIELNRREAIRKALERAEKDDCVLIAGKGHEKVQIFFSRTVSFDDVLVAKEVE